METFEVTQMEVLREGFGGLLLHVVSEVRPRSIAQVGSREDKWSTP